MSEPDDIHRTDAVGSSRSVGRYEIISEIGRGGMAIVYLARQRDLDRLVALKELSAFHAGSRESTERFLRESRLAGSLSHPNIVTVHEYFEERGIPHIAMEYVPAGSLRPWVGKLTLQQLAGVFEGILAGLAQAEQTGIVHRDLKPENIMVTADGRVKIADFGIAKATQGVSTAAFMTATGMTVGTPTYMAPEQAMAHRIGPWTDLYSVGVMAHEQLVGKPPFTETDTPVAILMRHVNERIPSVTELRPEIDPALSDWVDRLLVKNPEERTQSAVSAWDELEEIVLTLVGPRWRRDARLPEQGPHPDHPSPLTPAPFASEQVKTPDPASAPATPEPTPAPVSGFVTYGAPPRDETTDGEPAVGTPPPAGPESHPSAREPPTPPAEAAQAGAAASADEAAAAAAADPAASTPEAPPAHESEFVTFGEPADAGAPVEPAPAPVAPESDEAGSATEEAAESVRVEPEEAEESAPAEPEEAEPRAGPLGAEEPPAAPHGELTAPPREAVMPPRTGPEPTAGDSLAQSRSPDVRRDRSAVAGEPEPAASDEVADPPPTDQPADLSAEPAVTSGRSTAETDPGAAAPAEVQLEEPVGAAKEAAEATPSPRREEPVGAAKEVAEPRPSPRRSRSPVLLLAAGGAFLAALVGFLLTNSGSNKAHPAGPGQPTRNAQASSISLRTPSGWQQQRATPAINGLKLEHALAVKSSATGAELAVAPVRSHGPTLLPASLLASLPSPPAGETIRLPPYELLRYRGLGASKAYVYAIPTTAGTLLGLCVKAPGTPASTAAQCERMLATVRYGKATAVPVGPNGSYAQALSAAVSRLNETTAGAHAQLQHAHTPARQSAAARRLAADYKASAQALSGAHLDAASQAANEALVAALKRTAAAYGAMAAAAGANDRARYERASRQVGAGIAAVKSAFNELQKLGYTPA